MKADKTRNNYDYLWATFLCCFALGWVCAILLIYVSWIASVVLCMLIIAAIRVLAFKYAVLLTLTGRIKRTRQ